MKIWVFEIGQVVTLAVVRNSGFRIECVRPNTDLRRTSNPLIEFLYVRSRCDLDVTNSIRW